MMTDERKEGFFRSILTEDDDNRDYDPLRLTFLFVVISSLLGFWTFIGLSIYDALWKSHDFDMTSFATALGVIMAAFGALILQTGGALWISSKQENSKES